MSDSLQPPHAPTPLTANEILALDVLVEHGFDLTRALHARPDLAFEIQSMHSTMSTLDAYSAEGATGDADPDLVALTLARVDRTAREESDRLQIGAARNTAGSGQWRDIVAIAAVALLVVSVAVPVLSYVLRISIRLQAASRASLTITDRFRCPQDSCCQAVNFRTVQRTRFLLPTASTHL